MAEDNIVVRKGKLYREAVVDDAHALSVLKHPHLVKAKLVNKTKVVKEYFDCNLDEQIKFQTKPYPENTILNWLY